MCGDRKLDWVVDELRRAGCVAAEEEARELVDAVDSKGVLDALVARRVTGEPLAWITGRSRFCGIELRVAPGVFVPRWQSEPLARTAASLLAVDGLAVDLCTGAGSVAAVLVAARPGATIIATERDPAAIACARSNGVHVFEGDLFSPLPAVLRGRIDVLTAVAPYVPRLALRLLPHDVTSFEPALALDGGADGLEVVRRIVTASPGWLRPGGHVLLEVGSDQCDDVGDLLARAGFGAAHVIRDDDGDPRGIWARFGELTARATQLESESG